MFWTPAFSGVTLRETFYEIIKFHFLQKVFQLAYYDWLRYNILK